MRKGDALSFGLQQESRCHLGLMLAASQQQMSPAVAESSCYADELEAPRRSTNTWRRSPEMVAHVLLPRAHKSDVDANEQCPPAAAAFSSATDSATSFEASTVVRTARQEKFQVTRESKALPP